MIDLIEEHGAWLHERRVVNGAQAVSYRGWPQDARVELVRQNRHEREQAIAAEYRVREAAKSARVTTCSGCGMTAVCWQEEPRCVACGGLG